MNIFLRVPYRVSILEKHKCPILLMKAVEGSIRARMWDGRAVLQGPREKSTLGLWGTARFCRVGSSVAASEP